MSKNKNSKTKKIKEAEVQVDEKIVQEKVEKTNPIEGKQWFGNFGGILWALFLVFIGTLFLLNNFDIIPWSIWGSLWRLWPLFIIFAGIQLIAGRSKILNLVIGCLSFILLSTIVAIVVSVNNTSVRNWIKNSFNLDLGSIASLKIPEEKKETITVKNSDFENIEARKVTLEVTAGEFSIKEDDTENYLTLDAVFPEGHGNPLVETNKNGSTLDIQFDTQEKSFWTFPLKDSIKRKYDFSLGNPNVSTDIDLTMTAGEGNIQFNSLALNNFKLEMTAGDLDMSLGETSVPDEMSVKLTAGELKLSLPQEVGVKVNYDLTAGSLKVDGQKFDVAIGEGTYETENFDKATRTLVVNIEMTAGDVTIVLDN